MADKTLIIAEAGVNHNGDPNLAFRLIRAAAETGIDIVKFQTFTPKLLATKAAGKAEYQVKNEGEGASQLEMLQKLHLPENAYPMLMDECAANGIEFLSSPFDLASISFLQEIGITRWKIPSGEITNYPYLKKIAACPGQVILSTGMATLQEIEAAIRILNPNNDRELILLHCNTEYPTPFPDVNLRALETLRRVFGVPVGYSDHTAGIEVAVAAVALGAAVIEKHFTLDRSLPGPDHQASIEPTEFKSMVLSIRNIEAALGNGQKAPSQSESKNIPIVRKSLVAARRILAGETFSDENLTTKRPGTGISPMLWESVVGRKAKRNFEEDEMIEL